MLVRRIKLFASIFLLPAAVLLTLACGGEGSSPGGPSFVDAGAVKDGLEQAGIACVDYASSTPDDNDIGRNHIATEGECTADGETLDITTFKDSGAQKNYVGLLKGFGCALAQGFGISSFALVEGNLWIVSNTTETLANKVADRLGATAKVYNCD